MSITIVGGGNPSGPTFPVQRSVRLRSSASAYFGRTLTTPTNNKIWTWSAWVKRGKASGTSAAALHLFGTGSGSTDAGTTQISFYDENLLLGGYSTVWLKSNAVYRDPSSWYHIVVAWDNSNATAANRAKIYVNGVEITYVTDNRASLSTTSTYGINQAVLHTIGAWSWNNGTFAQPEYYDGYLTEVNFIDGQALTPTSFGAYNSYGVWSPAKYTGTYGTNGFYLNFQDNSAATAAAIGKDSSGNGNNWTPNNISVTAGVTYDSMLDVPTLTSATNANFSTLNPLQRFDSSSFAGVYSSGNLIVAPGGVPTHAFNTIQISAGDTTGYYWEGVCTSMDTARTYIGICCPTDGPTSVGASYAFTTKFVISNTGQYWQASTNGVSPNGTFTSYAANDILMVAYKNGSLWIGKNGTWMNSGDPAAGTGAVSTTLSTSKDWFAYFGYNSTWSTNFGQRPFSYTPPSGFKSLNTYNLPAPTIPNGAAYMAATTYTGNGANPQNIANTVNGVSFQPDFVWTKIRSTTGDNFLADAVRGAANILISNTTGAEIIGTGGIQTFNSNGFGVNGNQNTNAATYVGWQWKANGTPAVTNTSGSIPSTISANTTAGFSIVTYTGTGANATVGHGLGIAPKMVIVKARSIAGNSWGVYHSGLTSALYAVFLNQTIAQDPAAGYWNSTAPTSTVFSIGTSAMGNSSTATYVAYCFSEIAGYSKFGSYTGNGSTDGPFVYLGFRPRFILIKTSNDTYNWVIYDTSRETYNVMSNILLPNSSGAEQTNSLWNFDVLSNGFKCRGANGNINGSGNTYIYACFAENPFKNSLAR